MIWGQEDPKPSKFVPTGSSMAPNFYIDALISKWCFIDESFRRQLGLNEVIGTDSHNCISGFARTEKKLGMVAHALYPELWGLGQEDQYNFQALLDHSSNPFSKKKRRRSSLPCVDSEKVAHCMVERWLLPGPELVWPLELELLTPKTMRNKHLLF